MKIKLQGMGYLREFLGREPQSVELHENSTLKDLLEWIGTHHAERFPPYLWDATQHQFRGPIMLVVDGKMTVDTSTPLREGLEVNVMYAVAGG